MENNFKRDRNKLINRLWNWLPSWGKTIIIIISLVLPIMGAFKACSAFSVGDKRRSTSSTTQSRPYLSIELRPGRLEGLIKDPRNSQLFLIPNYAKKDYFVLPFKTRNSGKIDVIRLEAEYSSPDQSYAIALGEKSSFLAAGQEIPETFRPSIYAPSIINNDQDNREFKISLVINYRSYDQNDAHIYDSTLELVLVQERTEDGSILYKIKESPNIIFGKK